MIDFRSLIKAGVHFGHQKTRWNPKMAPYIWGHKSKVHLIDVAKTASQMEKASKFLKEVAASGAPILWLGTKKAAQDIVFKIATKLNQPYVNHRWIGGTLSNYGQVKKSVTNLLHYEEVLSKSEKFPHYTKKELNLFQKNVDRLIKNVGGIRKLAWPLGAMVVVDVNREQSALKEAAAVGVPVVALVDTNGDPTLVDYVIPANDDAPRSIKIVLDYLAQAVEQGMEKAVQKKEEAEQAAADEEAMIAVLETDDEEDEEAPARKKTAEEPKIKKVAASDKSRADDKDDDKKRAIRKAASVKSAGRAKTE